MELEWKGYVLQRFDSYLGGIINSMYNTKYLIDGDLWQLANPKEPALKTYVLEDDLVIGIFQGSKKPHPELDLRIKTLLPGEQSKPFLLPHESWAMDLIIKAQHYRKDVVAMLDYFIEFYDNCKPFSDPDDRKTYQLVTAPYVQKHFGHIIVPGSLPIEGIAVIVEYLCLNEKRAEGAHQYRLLLEWIKEGALGQRSFMSVLNLAARHQEY